VKRSGRDESVWDVIHLCREAMLGIALYSYAYHNKQKCYVSYYCSCLLFNKLEKMAEQVLPGSEGVGGRGKGQGGEMAQTMYAHMNK
jgi:hypothetical protein